ncbi:SnodProt1 [Ilyonectria sp. MPI-CAGE-AT-0026]|nr:SnodProt1 [Ilyonectria sp. MPI-CAGE-AT-0026]
MHFSSLFSTATLLAPTLAVSVTYNVIYDDAKRPLSKVACWNEEFGLKPGYNEWQAQGNIPRILAMDTITGPESAACVTCWIIEYEDRARPFLAIDGAGSGIVLSLEGMNTLTNGKAEKLGRIDANATQVDMLNCGFGDPPYDEL